jgi:hypothetical protein
MAKKRSKKTNVPKTPNGLRELDATKDAWMGDVILPPVHDAPDPSLFKNNVITSLKVTITAAAENAKYALGIKALLLKAGIRATTCSTTATNEQLAQSLRTSCALVHTGAQGLEDMAKRTLLAGRFFLYQLEHRSSEPATLKANPYCQLITTTDGLDITLRNLMSRFDKSTAESIRRTAGIS